MKQYHDLLQDVLDNGVESTDRTGVGTLCVFGRQMRFDLAKGFPAVTTKKLTFNSMKAELLWMVSGSTNVHDLRAIQFGDKFSVGGKAHTHAILFDEYDFSDNKLKTVWDDNYTHQAKMMFNPPKFKGDVKNGELGAVYGNQWRYHVGAGFIEGCEGDVDEMKLKQIDQLAIAIEQIKNNPDSRRIIVDSWTPTQLNGMALPPCHMMYQFRVINGKLSCQVYIRSNDLFLGAPFNIASYALLTHMVAQVCNLGVGELVYTIGDAHIYKNQIEQVKEQLTREQYELPTLKLNLNVMDIDDFGMDDIELIDYKCHLTIKAPMAV